MFLLARGGRRRFGWFNDHSGSICITKTTFGWFLFFLLGCRFDTSDLFNLAYMSVVVSMRHYLSIGHLSAALLSAKSTPIDSSERRLHAAYAVSSVILAGKFATNQLTGAGNPFYPDKVLGAGCDRWAINAAVAFADEFLHRLGIAATYEHVCSLHLNVDDDR